MRQAGTRQQDGSGDMSPAEALRFYREFKKLKEAAGIPPYDPKDTDAIRRGFFGDFYDTPMDTADRSREVPPPPPPADSAAIPGMPQETIDKSRKARPPR